MKEHRADKQSNIFSQLHYLLDRYICLSDIDYMQGKITSGAVDINIAASGEDTIYAEYRNIYGQAKTTAIFDYKHRLSDYIRQELKTFRIGTSMWYMHQMAQQLQARSFIVCATDGELPLTFIETTSGKPYTVGVLESNYSDNVKYFWHNVLKIY